ncbi:MAG: hypothetical protein NUW01_13030 [Gemmatimonadaceae bacterium]|nr:hypothetical protein [Gemmatimonadaceae bacterium]
MSERGGSVTGERYIVVAVRSSTAASFYVHDRALCGRQVAAYQSKGARALAEEHAARLNAGERINPERPES